jgi:hypothetical protein
VDRDDFLVCAGVNNDESFSGAAVPHLLASAFNVLAVGRSDGRHSAGLVPADSDGPGRQKPEIVAPGWKVSWATPMVASCAALLTSHAQSVPALNKAGAHPEVMKALLLAGATKDKYPGWSHTDTQPLDSRYGAGEVNVRNSYRILVRGEHNNSTTAQVSETGWDHGTFSAAASRQWTFTVPLGCTVPIFSAVATWHRKLQDSSAGNGFTPTPLPLVHMNLRLYRSAGFTLGDQLAQSLSPVDNVQHLWLTGASALTAGTYTLQLTSDGVNDYGLAWRAEAQAIQPDLAFTPGTGGTLAFRASALCPGLTYTVQSSDDLATWTLDRTLLPTSAEETWTRSPSTARRFYRLRWSL